MYNKYRVFTTYPSPLPNPLFLLCFYDKKYIYIDNVISCCLNKWAGRKMI